MNTLELIGLVVLHALWQGVIVGGSFLIGSWFLGKNNPLAKYRLAGVHLLWLTGWVGNTLWHQLPDQASGTISEGIVVYGLTQADILAFLQGGKVQSMDWIDTLSPWLGWIWLAGVMILSARLLGGLWYVNQLRKQSISSPFEEWQQVTDKYARRLGIQRTVKLAFSRKVSQPMTIGLLRPIILLPVELMTGLPLADLDMVLAHELAHIRRADYLINVLQNVLEIAFFFHPVVWWISRDMRRSREACCDDLAVGITGDAIRYAQTLTRLQRLFISQKTILPMTYLASPATLRLRVERLFVAKSTASPLLILPALAFIAGLMLLHPWNNPQLSESIQATASSLFQPAVQPSGIVPSTLLPTESVVAVQSSSQNDQSQVTPSDPNQSAVLLIEAEADGHVFYFLNTHTKEDLDQLKADMATKGITLEVFNVNFNDGLITSLGVTVKTARTTGTFSIEPFKILIVEVSEDLGSINFTTNTPPPPPPPTMPVVPGSRVNDAPPPPTQPVINGSRLEGTVAPPPPPMPAPTPTPNAEREYPIPPPPPPAPAGGHEDTDWTVGPPLTSMLVVVDGVIMEEGAIGDINEDRIAEVNMMKGEYAIEKYGDRARNGVVEITTKKPGIFGRNSDAERSGELKFKVRGSGQPLFELDGEIVSRREVESLSPDDIFEVVVIKSTDDAEGNQSLIDQYGEAGKNGVVQVRTKKAALVDGDVREIMTTSGQDSPIYLINGERVPSSFAEGLNPDNIASINVLKGEAALDKYGEAAKNGVVEITMK